MDKYLQTQWDARRAPLVSCVHYMHSPLAFPQSYHIHLGMGGIELHAKAPTSSLASALFSRKKKRDDIQVIPWADVLGAEVLSSTADPTDTDSNTPRTIEFVIYGCINKGRGNKRLHSTPSSTEKMAPVAEPTDRAMAYWTFRYGEEDGIKKIPYLVSLIQSLADPRAAASLATGKPSLPLPRRKYLVYINPVGGAGRAKHIFKSVVAPIFDQSNIECEVVITQHQAHATEHIMELPLDTYDCVVSIGGDGLLSEILQGIMKRDDWKRAIRQPLGIIPGGSGNGLSAALLARSNERPHALNAAYSLAKGVVHDLDISTVLNSHQEVMYSFLSLEWAFIADVDIESERFRMFGGFRFTISAVAKILGAQIKNAGKIRYLSSENDTAPPPKYHERDHGFDGELAPAFDCFAARPEQKEPVVNGEWKELEGDFHLFWGMNVTHGASDAHVVPGAGIDDGYYYLLCAPAPFSRIELAKLLLGLETGAHVNQKNVQIIRTRAFTLEVDNPADLIVIDGERFKGPKVQVEVHRGLGRVVCLPRS